MNDIFNDLFLEHTDFLLTQQPALEGGDMDCVIAYTNAGEMVGWFGRN